MRCPLLVALAAAILVPADAAAKVSCESRGFRTPSAELRGLPRSPVVARTYTVRLSTRADALNPNPALMTMYCGAGTPLAQTTPANGWFGPAEGPGAFAIRVRFPEAGPWAVSVMDLDGSFYDLGRREVRLEGAPGGSVGEAVVAAAALRGFPVRL
jgi:hypothetical protein